MGHAAPIRILILLLFTTCCVLALAQTQRYEFKHSFRAPFYLGRGGTLPFWEFGGSAIVSEDRIRLTPALQSRVGWVWNSVAADMDAWEVQIDFEIGGGGSRGADGMAFWYVAEPKREGISMGSTEEFRGMALYFDTFDNDGQNDEPKLSLWVNDGTQRYDPFDDGKRGEKARCSGFTRDARSKVRVVYRDGIIQVETDAGAGQWAPCITHHEQLPKGYYFGLSAATGHLTDNHDVHSLITYNLDPWRRRAPQVQEGEAQPTESVTVKPNPYLPKDPPNPYLPKQTQQPQEPSPVQEQQQQQPEQQQQQQQQQQQPEQQQQQPPPQHHEQPRVQEDAGALASKVDQLTFKLEAVRNQQDSLAFSLSQVLDKVGELRQSASAPDVSNEVSAALQEVRALQSSVAEHRRLTNDEVSAVKAAISDLRSHVTAEQGNTYNNVARLVRELQQHVSTLQTLVERGDRDQNNALQELKTGKEELKSVVEKSGSVAWWIYFCFFQVCFGVGFIVWKKAKDEANKKFL
jgi:mannose-binding lectin 1